MQAALQDVRVQKTRDQTMGKGKRLEFLGRVEDGEGSWRERETERQTDTERQMDRQRWAGRSPPDMAEYYFAHVWENQQKGVDILSCTSFPSDTCPKNLF